MKSPRSNTFILGFLILTCSCASRHEAGSSSHGTVKARQWSKVDEVVHYSGWKKYPVRDLNAIAGYDTSNPGKLTRYGSYDSQKVSATGFYRTEKISGRWWIIDPDGYLQWNAAVNGVRPGTSERNHQALVSKYGNEESWIRATLHDLASFGFNGTACWSDTGLIRSNNGRSEGNPTCYTLIWNFYSGFQRQKKQSGETLNSFEVFSPGFESYCESLGKKIAETRDDPNLLGHFSDNELSFSQKTLDEYLAIEKPGDPNRLAAERWLSTGGISHSVIGDADREAFLGVVAEKYYGVVAGVLKKYDPNHLFMGSRLHGRPKHNRFIVAAAGRYADIISVNYYGHWEPVERHFSEWDQWSGKPVIITEFYTKGDDSGLPNISGAGWRVATQEERGLHYENFCIGLLQMKNCVGAHWFRYMDNDPTDTASDPSNNDSNKGIVDNSYSYYRPLVDHMFLFNRNRYKLIRFFDQSL